jgi:antitoxin component of MazEF toxin-antitoxin module
MTRQLQKVGNSKGIVLTRLMLEHLGVTDEVEVLLEEGQIRITAPRGRAPRRQHFEEAKEATFAQYDVAMQRLADAGE